MQVIVRCRRPTPLPLVPALFCAVLWLGGRSQAQTTQDGAAGLWRTEDGDSIVEITKCGDSICGHLVSFPPIPGEPAINAELCNLQILGGFKSGADDRWVEGWIVDLEAEQAFHAAISVIPPDRLEVRAYAEDENDGVTVTWARHSGALDRCAPAS